MICDMDVNMQMCESACGILCLWQEYEYEYRPSPKQGYLPAAGLALFAGASKAGRESERGVGHGDFRCQPYVTQANRT